MWKQVAYSNKKVLMEEYPVQDFKLAQTVSECLLILTAPIKLAPILARSYNGHYFGLSIRLREFDSPTSRQVWPISSGVEQRLDKAWVGGSRPPLATKFWAGSDNGSTGALQAFSRGSIPRRSTMLTRVD